MERRTLHLESRPGLRLRSLALCAIASLGIGCGDDDGEKKTPDPDPECPVGEELTDDGSCIPIEPTPTCGDDQVPTEAACADVGVTSCKDFETSGTSCSPPSVSCAELERPDIASGQCVAMGRASCPTGFDLVDAGCEPILPEMACPAGSRAELGSGACVSLGDCNAAFPPGDATLFVDASFSAGELDATHVLTITEALAVASSGDVIAVESGTYTAPLVVPDGVELVGRCAGEVVVDGGGSGQPGLTIGGGSTAEVRGVTITGFTRGVQASGGSSLTIEESAISGNVNVGVLATQSGTTVSLHRSAVTDSQSLPDGSFGYGLDINAGAQVTVDNVDLSRNQRLGIQVTDATTLLSLNRVVVRETVTTDDDEFGVGLVARGGATVNVTESAFADNYETGIVAVQAGTDLTVTDSTIIDTVAGALGFGRGVDIGIGANATFDRVTVRRSVELGLFAGDPNTSLTITDSVVDQSLPNTSGAQGSGVHIIDGAEGTVLDTLIRRSGDQAVFVADAGSVLTVERSLLADGGNTPSTFGRGASAYAGATLQISDSAALRNREIGLLADGTSTTLSVARTAVHDVAPRADGTAGLGAAAFGATATFDTTWIASVHGFGIYAPDGATVSVVSSIVEAVAPEPLDQRFGRGIAVQGGSTLTVVDTTVRGIDEVGLFVSGTGTTATVTSSVFRDPAPLDPAGGGVGVACQLGGSTTLESSLVASHQVAGVLVNGQGTTLSAQHTIIRDTASSSGGLFGHGAIALEGARMDLTRIVLRGSEQVGAAYAGAFGQLSDCFVLENGVGLHVQDGTEIVDVTGASDPSPNQVQVTDTTVFEGNEVRLGEGNVPLPSGFDEGTL